MPGISAVFSDVGGVLLTNGFDREERARFVQRFGLDGDDFEGRHHMLSGALDAGQLSLDEYLDRSVFFRHRDFSKDTAREFIFSQSQALPDSLAVMERLARHPNLLLATLNNESRELNRYRIEKFGLRKIFPVFFSSCYLGVSKPHARIFELALALAQRQPQECVFIDDRALNVESAARLGLHAIQFQNAAQLAADLHRLGIDP